jgi:ketosteroid isomerase-like protein
VIRFVDKDKKNPRNAGVPSDSPERGSEIDELYRKLTPEMRRAKPSADALAAALEAAQRLAAENDAEQAVDDTAQELQSDSTAGVCRVCGYHNRGGNKFCGMCGVAVGESGDSPAGSLRPERRPSRAIALHPNPFLDPEPEPEPEPQPQPETQIMPQARAMAPRPTGQETHHYHHHYHHHYFPGGQEGMPPRSSGEPSRDAEKMRPTAALRGDMSRAEAAVRRIAHEWVLASNTKHLDDLLDLYIADAYVLRSNVPPVRGSAAVREFFFGALDSGLGEVEVEPLRVEVAGDMAFEAGRWKALVPSATGKRREERGKYLWVCARQSNGEWKLAADCWSSDLTLTTLESDVPSGVAVKSSPGRKNS